VLHFDATTTGPDMKAMFNWYRKQFAKLGIQLIVRSTDYNRFQEKMDKGEAQIFSWGWNADYPDPENFLFLLYGPNGKVEHRGENAANYHNKTFDALFVKMRAMENGPERQRIIDEMIEIARADGPWLWGFHPQAFALYQRWVGNVKPNMMARNTLKYWKIDQRLRADSWQRWNRPRLWPLLVGGGLLVVAIIPAMLAGRRRRRTLAGP
jgi:oligopeptide transport system substrate-binding protein